MKIPGLNYQLYSKKAFGLWVSSQKLTIAVILGISVRAAVFPAATLTDSRRAFHDCLNAVEAMGIGKVHLIAPF